MFLSHLRRSLGGRESVSAYVPVERVRHCTFRISFTFHSPPHADGRVRVSLHGAPASAAHAGTLRIRQVLRGVLGALREPPPDHQRARRHPRRAVVDQPDDDLPRVGAVCVGLPEPVVREALPAGYRQSLKYKNGIYAKISSFNVPHRSNIL